MVVLVCVLINIGILVFFKYSNFLLETIEVIAKIIGVEIFVNKFDIILPVGISFYTFQALI